MVADEKSASVPQPLAVWEVPAGDWFTMVYAVMAVCATATLRSAKKRNSVKVIFTDWIFRQCKNAQSGYILFLFSLRPDKISLKPRVVAFRLIT